VLGGDAPKERVAVSLAVTVPLFELVGVVVGEPERVPDDDLVPLDERVGVTDGDAPLEIVAVDEAVSLDVLDDVALFVGVTDDERVKVDEGEVDVVSVSEICNRRATSFLLSPLSLLPLLPPPPKLPLPPPSLLFTLLPLSPKFLLPLSSLPVLPTCVLEAVIETVFDALLKGVICISG
jgi:hypothetical protein